VQVQVQLLLQLALALQQLSLVLEPQVFKQEKTSWPSFISQPSLHFEVVSGVR
jgi:hypothetical protein